MLVTDIGDTYVGDKIEMLITEEKSPKILKLSPLQSHHHTGTTGPVVQPIKKIISSVPSSKRLLTNQLEQGFII